MARPTQEERVKKLIVSGTIVALRVLHKMLILGVPHKRRAHPDPPPKTAKEAAEYAKLRFQAATTFLHLCFGTKTHGPIKTVTDGAENETLAKLRGLSRDELEKVLAQEMEKGALNEEEAKRLLAMVDDGRPEPPRSASTEARPGESPPSP